VNGNDDRRWRLTTTGDHFGIVVPGQPIADCLLCLVKRPLTRAEADQAAAQAMGLFEVYQCPNGLGWHLRVVKDTGEG
jgi:hypothetical protein